MCFGLASVGCSKGKKDDKSTDKPKTDKPTTPPAPQDTTDEARLARLATFKDRVCKCADKACAETVNKELQTWIQGVKRYQLGKASQPKARATFTEYQKCQLKLTGKPFKSRGNKNGTPKAGTATTKAPATANKPAGNTLPPKYETKVKSYMVAVSEVVTKHTGDCNKMATALGDTLDKHLATITMIQEQRANPAVQKWTKDQKDLTEQGKKLGEAFGKCRKNPHMRAILDRLAGKR